MQPIFFEGMDKLSSLQYFVRVVDSGSFSQAARELGVGQPAVSKQIAALAQRLGTQLLNRTSRALRPTPAGAELYSSAVNLLEDLDDLENRITDRHRLPNGAVRVATPAMMTSKMLVPRLPEFYRRFPDVTVEFSVSERRADLVQEGLDMAIRVGNLDDSGLVARRVGSMELATVASSDYLSEHGIPQRPSDLMKHRLLASRYRGGSGNWRLSDGGEDIEVPVSGIFSSNDPADLHAAVLAGLGIAHSARALFDAQLRSGEVVEVLADYVPSPLPIHLIFANSRTVHRVGVVADFIVETVSMIDNLRI